jgi:hypothetical protein
MSRSAAPSRPLQSIVYMPPSMAVHACNGVHGYVHSSCRDGGRSAVKVRVMQWGFQGVL